MIPRGAPYIGWTDLLAAMFYSALPGDGDAVRRHIEVAWARHCVAFLSVRSGLDALLQSLALPAGSEIIMSAITIPHIVEIIAAHGLVAVPVDIDLDTLSVSAADIERAVTPRTKAVLIAHLFGSRMPLDDVASVARAHGLLLIEDCAQANDGSSYRGHAGSDVTMFSFGSIKRQTALGGGLLSFRDAHLAESVRRIQSTYPQQTRGSFLNRVLKMVMVKSVGTRAVFPVFVRMCRTIGLDHDATLGTALRGFTGGDLFARLRQRPSAPLVRLLERRLRQSTASAISDRVAIAERVTTAFPALQRPGGSAHPHTYWLFPMMSPEPERLMRQLWSAGFDATCGASNLVCVSAPRGVSDPANAMRLMKDIVYLPLFPGTSAAESRRLADVLRALQGVEVDQPLAVSTR
jgi:dTDP-4-amino-4,6-dideoxygalactose transaminase